MTASDDPTFVASCLVTAVVVLGVALAVLAGALMSGRWWQRWTRARGEALLAPVRPLLVRLVADEDEADAVTRDLLALPARVWRDLEPVVASMLGKLRGDARAALVRVLVSRHTLDVAVRDSRRRRASTRARAADRLGLLGHEAALAPLSALLDDPDPEVRAVATRSLGRLGAPAAEPLVRALADPRRPLPPLVMTQALTRIGSPARAALRPQLHHPDDEVRALVVELSGLLGTADAVDTGPLVEALREDPSPEVRRRAARALGRLGPREAVPALLPALGVEVPEPLRITAAHALGQLGDPDAVPALAELLDDPRHWVAHTAAQALVDIGPSGRDALETRADAPVPGAGAEHAREALTAVRGARGVRSPG